MLTVSHIQYSYIDQWCTYIVQSMTCANLIGWAVELQHYCLTMMKINKVTKAYVNCLLNRNLQYYKLHSQLIFQCEMPLILKAFYLLFSLFFFLPVFSTDTKCLKTINLLTLLWSRCWFARFYFYLQFFILNINCKRFSDLLRALWIY